MTIIYFILITILCFINLFAIYNISSAPEIFRQPIQVFFIVVAFYKTFIKEEKIIRARGCLINIILLLSIYLLFQLLLNTNNFFNDFSNSLFGIIVFYVFYTARYNSEIIEKINRYSFYAIMVLSFLYIYRRIVPPITSLDVWPLYINSIYYPLCMLPFTFLKKKYALISIISVLLCSLISAKQGAFIAIVIMTFIYYYITQKMSGKRIGAKLLILILILSLIGCMAYDYIVDTYDIDIVEGFSTITEDGGNGRSDIYLSVLSKLEKSDISQIILGHGGLASVANDIGISAHNDFLEVLYDFGIVGFCFYFSLILMIFYNSLIAYKRKKFFAAGLFASLTVFFVLSMVSHIMFILKYGILIFSFWGMSLKLLYIRGYEK